MSAEREPHHLFQTGRNCWRTSVADRVAFLIDGEAYFKAFADAVSQAREAVYIIGWDIDSRVLLHRDERQRDLPDRLGPFLDAAVSRREELQVYVLDWDFAMLYALEREPLPIFKLDWSTHRRMHFAMDDKHPVGASHHQKIVVIDDAIAFVGGFDLTRCRWDTPGHRPDDPRRRDNGKPYDPFHDVQMAVTGEAAVALGELSRERWFRATGDRLSPPTVRPEEPIWPEGQQADLEQVPVAIARTEPEHDGRPQISEVKQLWLDLIGSARRTIYIENQYLTSATIGEALGKRLQEQDGPEVILVLPRECSGWLEETTMGVLRARLLRRLAEADRHERLRVYYARQEEENGPAIQIHAKVLVIDDRALRIGSSNLSNRSMGLDSECDLAIAAGADAGVRQGIAGLRNRLAAEHLGVTVAKLEESLDHHDSFGEAIEALRDGGRTLVPLRSEVEEWLEELIPESALIDPEKPVKLEELVSDLAPKESEPQRSSPLATRAWLLALVILLAFGLAAAWRWTPLSAWLNLETLAEWGGRIRATPWAPLLAVAAFVVGGLVLLPVTLLILATAISFGPISGFFYAMAGSLSSAALSYGIGRFLGRDTVKRLVGKRLNRISRYLTRQGMLVVAVIRMLPVAPFTIVNIVAGATHIRLRDYLLGTLIGMTPGMLAIILFEGTLENVLRDPEPKNFAIMGGVLVVLVLAGWGLKCWLDRKQRQLGHEPGKGS